MAPASARVLQRNGANRRWRYNVKIWYAASRNDGGWKVKGSAICKLVSQEGWCYGSV